MKLILSILLVLIIPILDISDIIGIEPIANNTETVKDSLGVDTGMSVIEFDNFRNEYKKKFTKLFPNFTLSMEDWFFNNKVNLNKIDEFERYGLYLKNFSVIEGSPYQKNAVLCDIIVTGKVVESIRDKIYDPKYKFEIDQIIKGTEVIKYQLGEIPKYLYFYDFYSVSVLNTKGVYFFYSDPLKNDNLLFLKRGYSTIIVYNDSLVCYERDRHKFDSAFKYKHGTLKLSKMQSDGNYGERYLRWYEECKIGSWNEVVENIKKIIEINDAKNFYKKSWTSD